MIIKRSLEALALLLGITYIVLQFFAFFDEGRAVSALLLIVLSILYGTYTKYKSRLFFGFLLLFSLALSQDYLSYKIQLLSGDGSDYSYYSTNILFMTAYLLLITKVLYRLNFKVVFFKFTMPIIVLLVLDIFCVTLVTNTSKNEFTSFDYILEFAYNAVIMLLLSVVLINYMFRNNSKSMLLLLGSICLVFSEIIQWAYFYTLEDDVLVFMYSLLYVVAFVFFYLQSQHRCTGPEPMYLEEDFREA